MCSDPYNFARAVDQKIEELSREEFFVRSGAGKRLLEEVFPLSRLALHFAQPGLRVIVEAFEDDGPVDGHISTEGYREEDFDVEVTHVHSYEASMRNELLHTVGVSPGAGPIFRDKATGHVIALQGGTDRHEQIKAMASDVLVRWKKKATKIYASATILVIGFSDITFYGHTAWRNLFGHLSADALTAAPFRRVYLLNCATNDLRNVA